MSYSEKLKEFTVHLEMQNRTKATITSYVSSVRLYFLQGFTWTFEDACRWKELQMKTMKPATVNLRIHALSAYGDFLKTDWRLKPVKKKLQQQSC